MTMNNKPPAPAAQAIIAIVSIAIVIACSDINPNEQQTLPSIIVPADPATETPPTFPPGGAGSCENELWDRPLSVSYTHGASFRDSDGFNPGVPGCNMAYRCPKCKGDNGLRGADACDTYNMTSTWWGLVEVYTASVEDWRSSRDPVPPPIAPGDCGPTHAFDKVDCDDYCAAVVGIAAGKCETVRDFCPGPYFKTHGEDWGRNSAKCVCEASDIVKSGSDDPCGCPIVGPHGEEAGEEILVNHCPNGSTPTQCVDLKCKVRNPRDGKERWRPCSGCIEYHGTCHAGGQDSLPTTNPCCPDEGTVSANQPSCQWSESEDRWRCDS